MARLLSLVVLLLSLALLLCCNYQPAFAAAEDDAVEASESDSPATATPSTTRRRKCRHITAVDPFPGKHDYSILYPHISEVTMRTHFHSHQVAGYLGKLNTFLKGVGGANCPEGQNSLLLHLVREMAPSDPLRKHAHQAYNHALYFAMLRKNRTLVEVRPSNDDESGYVRLDGVKATGADGSESNIVTIHGQTFQEHSTGYTIAKQPALAEAVKKSFGSIDKFKSAFVERALGHFASGWVWLMVDPTDGSLSIAETHDGDTVNSGHTVASLGESIDALKTSGIVNAETLALYPTAASIDGRIPLCVLDVWEHAYYLDYRSNRKEYVEAWFKAVDWSLVAQRLVATDYEAPKSQASPDRDYTYSAFY